jgi:hypothetical protein
MFFVLKEVKFNDGGRCYIHHTYLREMKRRLMHFTGVFLIALVKDRPIHIPLQMNIGFTTDHCSIIDRCPSH